MLSFSSDLSTNSSAFVLFVTENYEYKDENEILPKELIKKINLFLKSLKTKSKKEEISSFDISDKKKCFIIKVKKKHENYYFEEIGGAFFTYVKKFKNIAISNSTFNWWAIYILDDLDNKTVYTPKYFGHKGCNKTKHGPHVKDLWNIRNKTIPIEHDFISMN